MQTYFFFGLTGGIQAAEGLREWPYDAQHCLLVLYGESFHAVQEALALPRTECVGEGLVPSLGGLLLSGLRPVPGGLLPFPVHCPLEPGKITKSGPPDPSRTWALRLHKNPLFPSWELKHWFNPLNPCENPLSCTVKSVKALWESLSPLWIIPTFEDRVQTKFQIRELLWEWLLRCQISARSSVTFSRPISAREPSTCPSPGLLSALKCAHRLDAN